MDLIPDQPVHPVLPGVALHKPPLVLPHTLRLKSDVTPTYRVPLIPLARIYTYPFISAPLYKPAVTQRNTQMSHHRRSRENGNPRNPEAPSNQPTQAPTFPTRHSGAGPAPVIPAQAGIQNSPIVERTL